MSYIQTMDVVAIVNEELLLQDPKNDNIVFLKLKDLGGMKKTGKERALIGVSLKCVATEVIDGKQYVSRAIAMDEIYEAEKESLVLGTIKKSRVLNITPKGLFVDCAGMEVFIPNKRVANVFVDNCISFGKFKSNELVDTEVISYENGKLELGVVLEPINLDYIVPKGRYEGEVFSFVAGTVYVKLKVGNAYLKCDNPNWVKPLERGDIVSTKVQGKNMEKQQIWGYVENITFKASER